MSEDEDEEADDVREAHEKDMIADEIFMGVSGPDDGEAAVDMPLHPGENEEEEEEESGMKKIRPYLINFKGNCFYLFSLAHSLHNESVAYSSVCQ